MHNPIWLKKKNHSKTEEGIECFGFVEVVVYAQHTLMYYRKHPDALSRDYTRSLTASHSSLYYLVLLYLPFCSWTGKSKSGRGGKLVAMLPALVHWPLVVQRTIRQSTLPNHDKNLKPKFIIHTQTNKNQEYFSILGIFF